MTGINGVDPIVVDNLKIATQKPAVLETARIKVKDDRKERERGQEQPERDAPGSARELIIAVNKLNRFLQQNHISLQVQMVEIGGEMKLLMVDTQNHRIISEIPVEKALSLVKTLSLRGFSIDELI
jgi:uncharacterized FlaG/YvyC family protein